MNDDNLRRYKTNAYTYTQIYYIRIYCMYFLLPLSLSPFCRFFLIFFVVELKRKRVKQRFFLSVEKIRSEIHLPKSRWEGNDSRLALLFAARRLLGAYKW